MSIRFERMEGFVLGIGGWKDDGLFMGPPFPDDTPVYLYLNIFVLFGFIEIRVRLP